MAVVITPSARETFEQLLEKRIKSGIPTDPDRLRSAMDLAIQEYGSAMHWTGERIIDHCIGILRIFLRFDPTDDAVITCIVHHLLDDPKWTLNDMEALFGHDVRSSLNGEFLLSHVTLKNRRMSLEDLRLMFLKVADDFQLVLMLLSQQYHLLECMDQFSPDIRKRVCRDTLHIYAPVAARLGIYWLKNQMEAKAFPVVYPIDAVRIAEQIEHLHDQYGDFLSDVALSVQKALADAGIEARIDAREKQPYSIFHKMKNKSVTHVEDIYDLFALRVIVKDEAACYQALGILHRLGHPIAGRFKDYIAFPKPNGYKSLHTTLAQLDHVPAGMVVEVQVRTEAMQHEAEFGLTAHWSYKQSGTSLQAMHQVQVQRALMDAPATKNDEIFVLTPQGDIIELPEGAIPLDFAFHVHTTLGLSYKGAKVNGSIVPMNHVLENGDIVEILKYPEPRPSARWISLLKTASARARLRKYMSALSGTPKEEPVHTEVKQQRKKIVRTLQVARVDGIRMPVLYAKCCKPEDHQGEAIIGVIGRTGDVRVHRTSCKMLAYVNPERRIAVEWTEAKRLTPAVPR